MPKKVWKVVPVDEHKASKVARHLPISLPLIKILLSRGFHEVDQIAAFLDPRLSSLSDPFLLLDIEVATRRIWRAIETGESIVVFGDYDVDGITANALLIRVLKALGGVVESFVPDRLDEGYGLSIDALERCLKDCSPSLIITVDCGVNAVDSVKYANENGVDVIITDHHNPDEETANALAVVNPKLGNREDLELLSGVGVAFKLAHALVKEGRQQNRSVAHDVDLKNFLDFVALGTVADIVPLRGENRIFVRYGLERMHKTRWMGLMALKSVAKLNSEPEAWHLAYQLAPRINAAGRIGRPLEALRLLTTDDQHEAMRIAQLLDATNCQRQVLEKSMLDEAVVEIDEYFDTSSCYGLVVAQKDWHPGVVGIVASRLVRKYNRPVIAMGIDEEGRVRGSCRSITGLNILEILKDCSDFLVRFGGHEMAAGLELVPGAVASFRDAFNDVARQRLKGMDIRPFQHIDSVLLPEQLNSSFMEELKQLQPFGQDNPEPVWALCNIEVCGVPRVVGKNHLKFNVQTHGRLFDVIAFEFSLSDLPAGRVDIAFSLTENRWNGEINMQLHLKDIRLSEKVHC